MANYIYESPDGGATIYQRAMGQDPGQRVLIQTSPSTARQNDLKHTALWHNIHLASVKDPVLKDMLDQIEVYYHLQNSP